MIEDEEYTAREVLDGEWVSGWEAVAIAEEYLKSQAVAPKTSIGELLAQMAGSGYLPSISNDVMHTAPIEEVDVGAEKDSGVHDEGFADIANAPTTTKAEDRWRLVPTSLWAGICGFSPFEGLHVFPGGRGNWKLSSFTVMYTSQILDRQALAHEFFSDPGMYIQMASNVLFYRDALYTVPRFAEGHPDDDDIYRYNDLDLTRLNLPSETPSQRMEREYLRHSDVEPHLLGSTAPRRGRPGGKNGAPIAALTIKLMEIDLAQLKRYTAEAAGSELQAIFEVMGEPRNQDNCRKDAAGILREVKKARGLI